MQLDKLEEDTLIVPQARKTLTPRMIRQIRRAAEKANPGPYRLVTDTCECGGDYGCGHGEFPYEMVTQGIRRKDFRGRFSDATMFNFSESEHFSMEDGRHLENMGPATVLALCDLAESAFEEAQSEHYRDSWSRTFGLAVELQSFPTHELLNELHRRMHWR